ncbi:hypothetical protein V2G26_011973 [Clonostachys chloroleuca]
MGSTCQDRILSAPAHHVKATLAFLCKDSEDENHIGACSYHPGEMEVDDDNDFWADHDENIHGTIDSDWARKEYPGGFIWSCCEKNAEEGSWLYNWSP